MLPAVFEADATRISGYESLFIFGLLQTRDYAETVIRAMTPEISEEEASTRLEIRMRRQDLLSSASSPNIWVIMDEAAIRRRVGDRRTHEGQLRHLITMAERPKVTLQVVPFTAGAHQGMPGSFHLLEFHEEDPPMVYVENAGGGLVVETNSEVAWYRDSFLRLAAQALSPKDTVQMIPKAADVAW